MLKNWKTLSLGSVILRVEKPTIVTSLFSEDSTSLISVLESNPGLKDQLIEIRYDLFSGRSARDLHRILGYLEESSYSYIFTFRSTDISESELYYGIAADRSAPAIDVDISQAGWIREHPFIIASYHGTEGDLTTNFLEEISDQKAEILKIAIAYSSKEGFLSDLSLLSDFFDGTKRPVCFSPMGTSPFLRLVASYFISDLVYASLDTVTAEGQIQAEKLAPVMELF